VAGLAREQNDAVTLRGRLAAAAIGGLSLGVYALLVRGSLTIDLGIGRTVRPLGPILLRIAAPREVVFEVIKNPYLRRTPRALEGKLRVLERGEDLVLAEHFTPFGPIVTTTVETVRFEPPGRVAFRLVRGPVPFAVEQFVLHESDQGTELAYSGELGADLWIVGRLWGAAVARRWEAAVRTSLAAVKDEAERRTATARRQRQRS
jgi:hypothetical protein